ncbi:right-handed parallel beta-helix repeat-containing protein [Promethearchaeum syntrophicum]|uniref:Probable pectate lyase C n=1 Tax=Promethearchaeum syntrophicum TaxID=2594042 RepID=A0A5B9DAV0_9ARCH
MKIRLQFNWRPKIRSSSRSSLILGIILISLIINSLILVAFNHELESNFTFSQNKPNASYTNTTLTIDPTQGFNTSNSGNWNWAVNQPWCSGSGTFEDPYVIEDLILSPGSDDGLIIMNSKNYYFRIENVSATGFVDAGIYFEETCNGTIVNCTSSSNDFGVYLAWNSKNNTIADSTFESNIFDGIFLTWYSNDNFILNTTIIDCGDGIDIYTYSNGNQVKHNQITGSDDNGINVRSNIQDTLLENNSIDLTADSATGIDCRTSITNLTIINNTVYTNGHFQSYGLSLSGITDLKVYNNTVDAKNVIGINIVNIDGGIFGGNALINGGGYEISGENEELESLTFYSENNTVNGRKFYYYVNQNDLDNSDFTNAGQIYLIGCDTAQIQNQNVSKATHGITLINSHNVVIEDCNASNGWEGISLQDGSSFNTIENCIINNNYEMFTSTYGINIEENGQNNIITKCEIKDNGYGVYIGSSEDNEIKNCEIRDNGYGIQLRFGSSSNEIINNTIEDHLYQGIYLRDGADWNSFENNTIKNNGGYGAYIHTSINSTFFNNTFDNNAGGIYFTASSNGGLFYDNRIQNHADRGIFIDESTVNYNLIYGNIFNSNNIHAHDLGSNSWNNTEKGNYWDNVTTPDVDGNGIIDDPVIITPKGIDYLPMKYPDSSLYQDSDSDGLLDYEEVYGTLNDGYGNEPTDRFDADSDDDNVNDYNEIQVHGTDPNDDDSDDDLMDDGYEVDNDLDPLVNDANDDADADTLTNIEEFNRGTDPNNIDTDDDLMGDGYEVNNGLDPLVNDANDDADADTLTNIEEFNRGTDPFDNDTDNDLMDDGYEITQGLDPLVDDANDDEDEDALTNLEEFNAGTDPFDNDTDNDLMDDAYEVSSGLDPLVDDTELDYDEDGMPNLWEYENGFNAGDAEDADEDKDLDLLTNLQEYEYNTDPNIADTDGDGYQDGWEIEHETNPLDPMDPGDEVPFYKNGLFWTILGTIMTFGFGIIGIKIRLNQKKKLESIVNKKINEKLENSSNSDLNSD